MTITQLRHEIEKEIKRIREKAGEINIMASGGVDSGTLMALSRPDRVFTVRLPYGPKFDEYEDLMETVRKLGLTDRLTTVELDESKFDEYVTEAVLAIGRPIPHFNIFPLFSMFKQMNEMGITDVVCGDGPDESMAGYTRHLIMLYLYDSYGKTQFAHYKLTIDKLLPHPADAYAKLIGKRDLDVRSLWTRKSMVENMCRTDMVLMRPDMDDMSNGIAKHFGITLHRPYQDGVVDNLMYDLPEREKVCHRRIHGKMLLRQLAATLIPRRIAWREQKIGGPLLPVNQIKGWDLSPFDKSEWLKYQKEILSR
jgi:asparagine synthetase B (glutamine-hydrolysing)